MASPEVTNPDFNVRALLFDKDNRERVLAGEEPGEEGNPKLIGGNPLPGESPRQAALREIHEETGLTEKDLHNFREIGTLPNPHDPEAVRILFVAEIAATALRLTASTSQLYMDDPRRGP